MAYKFRKTIVMALGGSLVCPEEIDSEFVKNFRNTIRIFLKFNYRFVIVVGGGRTCRKYQQAAGKICRVSDEDKDWIGVHTTRLNAHLLRAVFKEFAHPVVLDSKKKIAKLKNSKYKVIIGSGWRPGWSTDFVTVASALGFGAKEAIIMGKPEYVYDRDNQKYPEAKPLPQICWREYRGLIPKKWSPGLHAPVDPVAAKTAAGKKIKIVVIGRDLKNFASFLKGEEFKGTVINS